MSCCNKTSFSFAEAAKCNKFSVKWPAYVDIAISALSLVHRMILFHYGYVMTKENVLSCGASVTKGIHFSVCLNVYMKRYPWSWMILLVCIMHSKLKCLYIFERRTWKRRGVGWGDRLNAKHKQTEKGQFSGREGQSWSQADEWARTHSERLA